jgi:hypothetical protein
MSSTTPSSSRIPPSLLSRNEKCQNRPYLVDRLAISLGNKHLGGWTCVDTIGDLGRGEVSALGEASSSKFKIAVICGLEAPKFQ